MRFDDEIPAYRPRKPRAMRDAQNSSFRNALLSKLRVFGRDAIRASARSRIAVRQPSWMSRRVIVQARYVRGDLAAKARLHLAYVEREGVESDGSPGILYGGAGEDGVALDRDTLHSAMIEPIANEKHQFRMIVSPEDARELDLTQYTRLLMTQVEKDLGQRLRWAAVNHYDTDNPHAHLIIRGVDRDGAQVRFERQYISRGLRHRAQELATQELGPRTELDHQRQLAKEVQQGRFTSLDRRIAKLEVAGLVKVSDLNVYQRERLRVLERMQLAQPEGRSKWRMAAGWADKLRADGERGDLIKQMHNALKMETSRYQIIKRFDRLPVVPSEKSGVLHGRIVKKGLSDKADGMYAVVETARGNGYHVALWRSEAAVVREGDLVTLKQLADSWVKPLDAHVAALATNGQGVVRPEVVLALVDQRLGELAASGIGSGSAEAGWAMAPNFLADVAARAPALERADPVTKALDALLENVERDRQGRFQHAAVLDGLRRRLGELVEMKLATHDEAVGGEGRWRVVAKFREALAERDHTAPKAHVALRREKLSLGEQIGYVGPTWLDEVSPNAAVGLASELTEHKQKRAAFLGERGIDPTKLRRAERNAVEGLLAGELGLRTGGGFASFQGRVERVHECPNGNRYAIIVSDKKLVAVATGKQTTKLVGRRVKLELVISEYDGKPKIAMTTLAAEQSRGRERADG